MRTTLACVAVFAPPSAAFLTQNKLAPRAKALHAEWNEDFMNKIGSVAPNFEPLGSAPAWSELEELAAATATGVRKAQMVRFRFRRIASQACFYTVSTFVYISVADKLPFWRSSFLLFAYANASGYVLRCACVVF